MLARESPMACTCGRWASVAPQPYRVLIGRAPSRQRALAPAAQIETSVLTDPPQPAVAVFPAPAAGSFTADRTSFSEEHRLRGYEVRPDQRATIVTISNLMQEVAGNHAVGMWGRTDAGFANLPFMKDLIFVMTRLQIRMHEYPKWGDVVKVETYFTAEGRLAARREWVITDAATNTVLGTATSTWVTINTATRRIAKVPDELKARFMRFAPTSDRFAIPVEETKRKLADFTPDTPTIAAPQQVARRSDMDMNGHINNVTYLAWALEAVPQHVYNTCALYEVEVDFKAECLQGERIESVCTPQQPPDLPGVDLQYLHSIRRHVEGGAAQELVRCRTSWKELGQGLNGHSPETNGNGK